MDRYLCPKLLFCTSRKEINWIKVENLDNKGKIEESKRQFVEECHCQIEDYEMTVDRMGKYSVIYCVLKCYLSVVRSPVG